MPTDEVLLLAIRSSLGTKEDLELANQVGVIDSDYADNPKTGGNIGICIRNTCDVPKEIKAGDSIAQGVFVEYKTVDDEDEITEERTDGFGHTDKK